MTPKEKAQQLIYAFEAFTDKDNEFEFAKQCAAIAVDEIIEHNAYVSTGIKQSVYDYWQEVKTEINNL
jgi:predicted SnoaL-like aldol condensation-catalyzing enzyme